MQDFELHFVLGRQKENNRSSRKSQTTTRKMSVLQSLRQLKSIGEHFKSVEYVGRESLAQ